MKNFAFTDCIGMLFFQYGSYNDIAIIKLKTSIVFNEYVNKVCLPQQASNYIDHLKGKDIEVVGYGQNRNDDITDTYTMREVDLKVYSKNYCDELHNLEEVGRKKESLIKDAFPDFPKSVLRENQFCSGTRKLDEGTCQGDSGAPALFKEQPNLPYIIYGVLHGSVGDNCVSNEFPSIFMRTDHPDVCLLYTSPSPRDGLLSRMPSSS